MRRFVDALEKALAIKEKTSTEYKEALEKLEEAFDAALDRSLTKALDSQTLKHRPGLSQALRGLMNQLKGPPTRGPAV